VKIALAILTWDELEGISNLYNRINFDLFDQVFAIDPGSTDGTLEFFKSKNIPVLIQQKTGRGNAFREGLNHTDCDSIVFFSGDGNEDPDDLPNMIKYLKEGYDLVIGGRFIRKGCKSDNSDDKFRVRWFGNVIFSLVCRIIWRTGVFDSINGYRAFKTDSMKKLKLDANKHEIELQSTIRASKLKMKIKEFPTKELLRIGNPRKSTAGTMVLGKTLSKTLFKELIIRKKFVEEN